LSYDHHIRTIQSDLAHVHLQNYGRRSDNYDKATQDY